ncbi:MAG: TlpA family protein disulfide reductase [Thermoplasmata archaeon]|nr:TlpA family protein disulfide reductase [Thermoplasmata archaeon]
MSVNENKPHVLLSILMVIVILLMIAIAALFLRMNQLQETVVAALSSSQGQPVGLAIGTSAPEFALVDTNGVDVSLIDYSGHWVLLGFTSITCPVCKTTYPYIKKFSEERSDIQVILISKGSAEENQQLVQEQGFHFPVLTIGDEPTGVILEYKVPGTPFFYLIDKSGVIRSVGFANTTDQIHALVDGVIK